MIKVVTDDDVVSVEHMFNAAPESIFELLADPSQHSVLDGSASVKRSRAKGPSRLSLGAKFEMDMRIGLPYRVTNTVTEFEDGRRIAWRHFGGHTWRWILEPFDGGTRTKVTEQFDMSTSKAPWLLKLMRVPDNNRKSMEKTMARLEGIVARAS